VQLGYYELLTVRDTSEGWEAEVEEKMSRGECLLRADLVVFGFWGFGFGFGFSLRWDSWGSG
jgi:hypothetical protein